MPRPIRALFLTTELAQGGAERALVRIATGLDRNEFEPLVCSIAPLPSERAGLIERLQRCGVPVRSLDAPRSRQVLAAISRLRKLIDELSPDLVQTFLFHANVLGAWALRGRSPRLVAGYRVADPRRWRTSLERLALRRADRAVCVSRSVRDFYVERRGFPNEKLVVVPNAVDVHDLSDVASPPDYPGMASGRIKAIFVGRLHRQKGLDVGLGWIRQAVDAGYDVQWTLVGDGPERGDLESRARARGLADRVHFVGWRANVVDWLAASDLFLLPSRWEGMPNALMEALAVGLPAVATDVEGVAEILGEGAAQQLVDPREAREKLAALLRDPALRTSVGEANRKRMIEHFRGDDITRRYAEIYREIVRGS